MNYKRKPRPGLQRPPPLPLSHLLRPPNAFLHNGPLVRPDVWWGGNQL